MEKVFTVFTSLLKTTEAKVQKSGLMYVVMALVMMVLAPSSLRGAVTTYDFADAAASKQYYSGSFNIQMGDNYSNISGANVGVGVTYRNPSGSGNKSLDLSRFAFAYNSSAATDATDGSGFYFYAERISGTWYRGLYTGQWNTKLAVLNLKPGDKVTFTYAGSSASGDNANLHNDTYNEWLTQVGKGQTTSVTVYIGFIGDLIVSANLGTMIQKIEIESNVAEYEIKTIDNTTYFEFKANGTLEVNDFALPYMSVSFGNKNDYLVVGDDLQSRMFKTDGTETLQTDASVDWRPVAGNFYAFKPTGGGTVTVEGGIQGECTHLFVYDDINHGWTQGTNGNIYKATYNTDDDHYISFSFEVEKNKTYYICINNQDSNEHGYAFHLHKFSFTNTFHLNELAKIVDLSQVTGSTISLTQISGAQGLGTNPVKVKRCTGNIKPNSVTGTIDQYGWLSITKPEFEEGTDEAGTVILDIDTQGGSATFVVTFPYHADYGWDETTGRSHGHIWNFIDPRLSDSNIGNCWIYDGYSAYNKGTATGLLSIGRYNDSGSQLRTETDNREWTYGWTIKSLTGEITDPMYKNVYDMEGDNADMIWETEGLWFDTGTNLSCLYNENDVIDGLGQPTQHLQTMTSDPDRYVGLVPAIPNKTVTDGAPSFTIPGLKDGDRVLIYMKSGEKSGSDREAIFLNIEGALDAVGTPIVSTDLYGAGGTQYHVQRYEGCYHFIKDASDTPMKFTMVRGAICKLMYIQIYSGKRIDTNHVEKGGSSPLLFLNDEGTAQENAASGYYNLHYRNKGENMKASILVHSGNLTDANSFSSENFNYYNSKGNIITNNYDKTSITFKSTVGDFGVFRLRLMDMDFIHDNGATTTTIPGQGYKYVCDFADRNFTVGYRQKMEYPYTWDFTDLMDSRYSSAGDIATENTKYPETTNKYERKGWDISFWGDNGYMIIGNPEDNNNDGDIFSQNKEGFGNQLYANDKILPETKGLWFYMDNNFSIYNRCAQITTEGIRFANTATGSHTPDWNYKMVVPSVPKDGAVYLRMKRDNESVKDTDVSNETPFLATKFHFGTVTDASQKTSLSTSTEVIDGTGNSNSKYSFYKVAGTNDEYIVAVKNTGSMNHLTFTLNGWIVEKVAVSTDPKAIGKTGYATESRARDIDHYLTSYLTGKPIKAYTATISDGYEKVVLSQVGAADNGVKILPAAENGDTNGCILYHDGGTANSDGTTNRTVSILDGGFHVFVPDMHDKDNTSLKATTTSNVMKSFNPENDRYNVSSLATGHLAEKEGTNTNLILTAKKYKVGTDGSTVANDGYNVFFVRVDPNGNSGQGATLKDCSAYIQIPTKDMVKLSTPNNDSSAKMSIVFEDEWFGEINNGIATGIDQVTSNKSQVTSAEWYNLNGQKLNGMPTEKGLYIVKGRKVLVK